jgi:hypothetical protein
VLAVALANKLARMARAVLNKKKNFEIVNDEILLRRKQADRKSVVVSRNRGTTAPAPGASPAQ